MAKDERKRSAGKATTSERQNDERRGNFHITIPSPCWCRRRRLRVAEKAEKKSGKEKQLSFSPFFLSHKPFSCFSDFSVLFFSLSKIGAKKKKKKTTTKETKSTGTFDIF